MQIDLLIKFFGMRRFGNHAVINWILGQSGNQSVKWKGHQILCKPLDPNDIKEFHKVSHRKTVVVNYEGVSLSNVDEKTIIPDKNKIFGNPDREVNVVILRDFYNWLASYMRLSDSVLSIEDGAEQINSWVSYAREYSSKTDHLASIDKVGVLFNVWHSSESYRREIAERLQIPFTDANFNKVSRERGGSSFDQRKYNGRANEMKLDKRWARFIQERPPRHIKRYKQLVALHPEARDLNDQIFGDMGVRL